MNITIISAVFPPEPVISAQTSYDIALELSHQSHNVKVVTSFPNRPEGKLFPGYSRKLVHKENHENKFNLIRCFSFFSKESSIISRTLENISFGFISGLYLFFSKKPDLIYSNTWPIFASSIVRFIATSRRIPLIISIQDVYPESLVVQNRISTSSIVAKLLTMIDAWIVKGSQRVITISKSFAEIYQKSRGISEEKVKVIPNWIDENSIELVSKNQFRKDLGIPIEAFVIVYAGNIGVAAGLEKFIKALENLKSRKEFSLIVAGSGSQLNLCKILANKIDSVKIIFHSPWLMEETSKVLASSDLLLLPTSGNQSMVSVPSKLISYMLASRPVLAICDHNSEIARIINSSDCGWFLQPEKLHEVNNIIETIINLPESALQQKGAYGREHALKNFTSEVCLPKVIDVINSVLLEKR